MARRVYRKSRKSRKTYRKRRSAVPRPLRNQHTMITRVAQLADFTINSNYAWTHQEYRFALSDLPSYSEFTSLFNLFKISAVKLTFFPQYDSNDLSNMSNVTGAGIGTISTPIIFTATTPDDTILLNTQASAMQVSSARMVRNVLKPFSIYVRPKFQVEAATTLGFSSATPRTGWCDTDNYGVLHYGAQIGGRTFYQSSTSTPNVVYQCFAKYYLQFKGGR